MLLGGWPSLPGGPWVGHWAEHLGAGNRVCSAHAEFKHNIVVNRVKTPVLLSHITRPQLEAASLVK